MSFASRLFMSGLILIALGATGCTMFEKPSQMECEAAIDNIMNVNIDEEIANDHPIIGGIVGTGVKWGEKLSGGYREKVKRCMVTMTRHAAICLASKSTHKELEQCW